MMANDKPKDKHPAAVALGKLNKGKTKTLTDLERKARSERFKANALPHRHKLKREAAQ